MQKVEYLKFQYVEYLKFQKVQIFTFQIFDTENPKLLGRHLETSRLWNFENSKPHNLEYLEAPRFWFIVD